MTTIRKRIALPPVGSRVRMMCGREWTLRADRGTVVQAIPGAVVVKWESNGRWARHVADDFADGSSLIYRLFVEED